MEENKPETNEKNDHQTIGIAVVFTLSHHRYETFNHYRSNVQQEFFCCRGVFYHLEKGFGRIKIVHFCLCWPFSLLFIFPDVIIISRSESLFVRQAEKLAQIYFSISTSPSLSLHSKYKFFAWIFFLFRSHFYGIFVE